MALTMVYFKNSLGKFAFVFLFSYTFLFTYSLILPSLSNAGVIIGAESKIPFDERQNYPIYVHFRPGNGQIVKLNPPRFSWPYLPNILFTKYSTKADFSFTLQISKSGDFKTPFFERRNISINFYNFLPELKGPSTWFWRVGYKEAQKDNQWSAVRSFQIAPDAVVWDRSNFARLIQDVKGHPRILFNAKNKTSVFDKCMKDSYSKKMSQYIIDSADKILDSPWYKSFPANDKKSMDYFTIGKSLVMVAFAYMLTGDSKYLSCKERFLKIASWPKGGTSSPEGVAGTTKWSTHLTEYLGLFYDWFYNELTPEERQIIHRSLEWRIDWTINNFAWLSNNGQSITYKSIGIKCSSHAYENLLVTIPGALAICDTSEVARKALKIGINYLVGITNGMGEDEAWSQGAGYGNGKMKWLMDATWYLQTTIPGLQLYKNKVYDAYIDFLSRITPIGAKYSSFGNWGHNELDWLKARITNAYRVAMLTKNSVAMQNWIDSKRRLADLGKPQIFSHSPWIDFVLPYYGEEPTPKPEKDLYKLFPLEGWVTVSSAPPSDYDAQKNAVSMTFACRPRGPEDHAFPSANSFDIYAFGETVTVGGGTTKNGSLFADNTMSHNTILIDGHGQMTDNIFSVVPYVGRIIAYRQGSDFVYWCGDATNAYNKQTGMLQFQRHVLFVDNAYFVIFDDLVAEKPVTFQWLYHITPAVRIDFDPNKFKIDYTIGDAHVILQHCANVSDLTFNKYGGREGYSNPITREVLLNENENPIDAYHLWISHKTPNKKMQFLAVIVPYRLNAKAPTIVPIDNTTVKVSYNDKEKIISFTKKQGVDISIDIQAFQRHKIVLNSPIKAPSNLRLLSD